VYFSVFGDMVRANRDIFEFTSRSRRPPRDPRYDSTQRTSSSGIRNIMGGHKASPYGRGRVCAEAWNPRPAFLASLFPACVRIWELKPKRQTSPCSVGFLWRPGACFTTGDACIGRLGIPNITSPIFRTAGVVARLLSA
jgi:hypothetical protein